jgi:hypothetical protein
VERQVEKERQKEGQQDRKDSEVELARNGIEGFDEGLLIKIKSVNNNTELMPS